jgi:hypothetical protein
MVVVLPQPLEPRKPKISPRRMRKADVVDGHEVAKAHGQARASMATSAVVRLQRRDHHGLVAARSSGSRAMKAASRCRVPVRASSSAACRWPAPAASMATSQSKRWASSM